MLDFKQLNKSLGILDKTVSKFGSYIDTIHKAIKRMPTVLININYKQYTKDIERMKKALISELE